jgi:hypothetical protein
MRRRGRKHVTAAANQRLAANAAANQRLRRVLDFCIEVGATAAILSFPQRAGYKKYVKTKKKTKVIRV